MLPYLLRLVILHRYAIGNSITDVSTMMLYVVVALAKPSVLAITATRHIVNADRTNEVVMCISSNLVCKLM